MTSPVAPKATRLTLIRHGQALCNVERRVEGVAQCRGLSELGRLQAARLGARLSAERFVPDLIVASPIRRARETAEILARALGRQVDVFDADVEEVRPGEAEGMTWDQYFAFYGAVEGWDPAVAFAPGGEAWVHFADRVSRTLDRLAATHVGQTVAVVAHGGVIDASVFHFFGLDPYLRAPIDFETANASLTEWELRSFRPYTASIAGPTATVVAAEAGPDSAAVEDVRRWRLARYNDAAHLHGL